MAYPIFQCAYEKDHNPPIPEKAEYYYKQAIALTKAPGILNWQTIIDNYQQAVDLGHWKAMNNLAVIYYQGRADMKGHYQAPLGVAKDMNKTLALYIKMVELEVPIGYYNWAIALENNWVDDPDPRAASMFMFKSASLGCPLAQARLGNFFAFILPRGQQRDDLAEQYFNCAGAQNNPHALMEVAAFYKIAKKNMPKALYYYQKAASLGSEDGFAYLREVFSDNATGIYSLGYSPNPELFNKYTELHHQLRQNPELRFPHLMQEYPLPYHPTQGYDADNPETRPE